MALYEHRYDDWNAVDLITHRSRISHMMRVKAESSSSQKLTLFAAVPTVVVVVVHKRQLLEEIVALRRSAAKGKCMHFDGY